MAVIGFTFNKFSCEKKAQTEKGSIEIKHNISIKNVEKTTLNVGKDKNEVLKIDFSFDVLYGSTLGKISMEGDVVYTDTPEIIKETLKGYEADKKLNSTVNSTVSKFIYTKGIVKALSFADELNLPAPIPVVPKGMFDAKKK